MKQLATAYSYNPSAKTVTLTGLNVPLGYILLVVNASRGQIIYNLADPLLASSSYQRGPDSVLTLNSSVDTSLHAASDSLTIFYDNGAESQMVLVQGPIGPQGPPGTTSWTGLLDKPTEFPPESHAHPITEITGLSAALAGKSSTQALAAEASTREAADLALGQRIDQALANLDPAAIDSIAEAVTTINTERTERIAADAALQTAIDGKAPATHTHTASQITDFASAVVAVSPPVDWSSLTGKPSTFAPSAHTHAQNEITGLVSDLSALASADTALGQRIDYLTENLDQTALDSIAEAAASIGTLQTQLNTHTHAASAITGLAEFIVSSAPALSITATTHIATGTTATYSVGGLASSNPAHVLVALNGVTQNPSTDYTISLANGTITFDSAPVAGTQIALTALGLRTVQPPIDPELYRYASDTASDGLTNYYGRIANTDFTGPASASSPVWTIHRTTFNAAGRVVSTGTATAVAWENRTTATYQPTP